MTEKQSQQNFAHRTASITVTSDRSIAPYIDTFAITPQNIIEREHGSLVGFFRIYDESEDSAYIANFLTSVLKKEFYASTRRDTETALEAALAKVNMALGELARHDSTQWVGKVDGAVCVFTHTSVCFSSCGHGSIQLFRNKTLTHISIPADDATHVLSTFSDIACGPLQAGDTFIIASREFDEILPHKECERACVRYTHTEREQLFRTALVNQTSGSCAHLVEITPVRASIARRTAAFDVGEENVTIPENVFSAQTFASTDIVAEDTADKVLSSHDIAEKTKDTAASHIYLHGDETDTHRTPFGDILMEHTASLRSALRRYTNTASQNIRTSYDAARSASAHTTRAVAARTHTIASTSFHTALATARHAAKKARTSIAQISARGMERYTQRSTHKNTSDTLTDTVSKQPLSPTEINPSKKLSVPKPTVHKKFKKNHSTEKTTFPVATKSPAPRVKPSFAQAPEPLFADETPTATNHASTLEDFLTRTPSEHSSEIHATDNYSITTILSKTTESIGAYTLFAWSRLRSSLRSIPSSTRTVCTMLLPHPRRIITGIRSLTLRQRIIAISIIACIIIVPLIFTKLSHRTAPQAPQETLLKETPVITTATTPEASDPTSTSIERAHTLHTDSTLLTLIDLRGETYAIAPHIITHITNASTKRDFTIPQTYGNVTNAVAMNDLNMIILRMDTGAIVSFTPQGSTKFVKNNITFPAGLSIDAIAVYRTYLYFFDSNANDIYRYPRITGGFGAAVDWLSDATDFSAPTDVTIDGTIYSANADGSLTSFFKRKQTSAPSTTLTPALHADALFSADEATPLFILDRNAQRIIALDKKTNAIQRNVTHDDFAVAHDFTVNERLSTITALLDDGTVATYKY